MKRFTFIPAIITLVFLLSFVGRFTPISYAQPTVTDCLTTCYSWKAWNGTTYGARASLEMAGSAMRFYTPNGSFQRWVGVWNATDGTDGYGAIHAGQEVDQPYAGYCNVGNGFKEAYFYVYAWNTSNMNVTYFCIPMHAANAAQPNEVQIGPYVSNGGGMLTRIFGYDGQTVNVYTPYTSGIPHYWKSMGMQEQIQDNVYNHQVWGAYDTEWEWLDSGGTYHLQDVNLSFAAASDPPQMYWLSGYSPLVYPGGKGIACVYDGGNVPCTHNG